MNSNEEKVIDEIAGKKFWSYDGFVRAKKPGTVHLWERSWEATDDYTGERATRTWEVTPEQLNELVQRKIVDELEEA